MRAGRRTGRRLVEILCLVLVTFAALFAPPAALSKGRLLGKLDRSFGTKGRAFLPLGNAFARSAFEAMVSQPNGGIVLAGSTETARGMYRGSQYRGSIGFLERRTSTGELDAGFGENGTVLFPQRAEFESTSLALRGDGRIVAGVPESASSCSPASTLHQLTPRGDPDMSFGSGGVSGRLPLAVRAIAIDREARIVVAGAIETSTRCNPKQGVSFDVGLGRVRSDGRLDSSFGEGGIVRIPDGSIVSGQVHGLTVRDDGAIVVATNDGLHSFNGAGAPDSGFGEAGAVELGIVRGVLFASSDGKVTLARSSAKIGCCVTPAHFIVSRYRLNGSLDPSFGAGGSVEFGVGAVDWPTALAADADGGILLGGQVALSDDCPRGRCAFSPLVARFTDAGMLDSDFGQAGLAELDLPPRLFAPEGAHPAAALALTAGGRILVAGGSGDGGDAVVSALRSDGAPDPAFGSRGVAVDRRELPATSEAGGLAIGPRGEIFTSAWSNAGSPFKRTIFLGANPSGNIDHGVGFAAGLALPGVDSEQLRVDGRNRYYAVAPASPFRGGAYVARFDDRGRPEIGYGSQGTAALPARFDIRSLIVRRNGAALVVGRIAGRFGMAAFKLDPRGQPVRRFGRNGLALVGFGRKVKAMARAAAFDRQGRVVLFGDHGPYAGMARLLRNGRPDPTFAYRGRQPYMPALANEGSAVAIAPDGRVLIAAAPRRGLRLPTTLIRFRRDGIRDRSFGHNGVRRVRAGGPMVGFFGAGRIILVSANGAFGERGVAIRAFRRDGRIDRRFGRRGVAIAARSQRPLFRPVAAARQPDGRIVVAGTAGRTGELGAAVELLRFR